jgi:hypothetical protein
MEHATQPTPRSIDVTGLPEEAIRAVESLVALLKGQTAHSHGGKIPFSSREEWVGAIREYAASHKAQGTSADWSRESIYAGRGE